MENLWQNDTGKTNRSLNTIIINHLMREKKKPINSFLRLTPFFSAFLRAKFLCLKTFLYAFWTTAATNNAKRVHKFPSPSLFLTEKNRTHQEVKKEKKDFFSCVFDKSFPVFFLRKLEGSLSFWEKGEIEREKYVKNVCYLGRKAKARKASVWWRWKINPQKKFLLKSLLCFWE